MVCRMCGAAYAPRPGRGQQSPYCPDCQPKHRRAMAGIRRLRQSVTIVNEWIEAIGPTILREKEDIAAKQDRRCLRCRKHRTLYLATDGDQDALIGLCSQCHSDWVTERRKPTHGNRNT